MSTKSGCRHNPGLARPRVACKDPEIPRTVEGNREAAGRNETAVVDQHSFLLLLGRLSLPSLVPRRELWGGKRSRPKSAAGFLLSCRDTAANDAATIPMHAAVRVAGAAGNPIYIAVTATAAFDLALAVALDADFLGHGGTGSDTDRSGRKDGD
jgi:hypothetical protein